MRFLLTFFRAYPRHTTLMLIALLFAGLAEGVGLSALLPLLNIATRQDSASGSSAGAAGAGSEFEQTILAVLEKLGISPGVGSLLIIIIIGLTIKNILLLIAKKQVGYTAAQVTTDLRLEMLRAILNGRWEYFVHQPAGFLTTRIASEAKRSASAFVEGTMAITMVIQAAVYLSIAFLLSWQATLISLAAGAVVLLLSHGLVRVAKRAGKKQTKVLKSLMARVVDTVQSIKPLKAMAKEHLIDRVFGLETSRLNRSLQRQVLSTELLRASQEQMFAILIAVGMFVALVQFDMPLSTVMVLVVVLGRMLNQLGKVQKQQQKMVIGESAFWSLKGAIQDAQKAREILDTGGEPVFRKTIRLDSVSFSYERQPIVRDISLEIPAGCLTTLIGPSGSGKTTIVDLVIGLLRPQSGEISIDGTPLSDIDLRAWRGMIGYVPQETLLLHDSILHNVTLDDPDLNEQDAERALRAAGAWEFVSDMPEGMHSTVGERGTKLSGGQRQRIMIARALVNKPSLLILDEATSALDPKSEAAIGETMQALRGQLTILAISHQTALVDVADRVYRLQDGTVRLHQDAPSAASESH
jgi:ATP-binding cassette subfamily C protein